jgi:hypothetical protein
MANQAALEWAIRGTVAVACNCDYGCPCNFNGRPSTGKCEGQWTWHIEDGRFGDTELAGLNFTVAVNWPGAIHEGNGEALILVDERADETQRSAISTLVEGDVGGPWGILAWTWPKVHGPTPVPYEVDLDGVEWRVKAGAALVVESTTIKNPVSGAEVHPGATLPEGIVFKRADFGSSTVFRVNDGIFFEHPGRYTAVAPFAYAGPS